MKNKISYILNWKVIGILLSTLFIIFSFHGVDIKNLVKIIISVPIKMTLLIIGINFLVIFIKVLRWQAILNPTKKVGKYSLTLTSLIGLMANNILPVKAGDLVKVIILGKRENISKATLLGTVTLERIFDGIGMVIFLSILPIIFEVPSWFKHSSILLGLFLTIFLILIFILIKLQNRSSLNFNLTFPFKKKHIDFSNIIKRLGNGFVILDNPIYTIYPIILSIISWLIQVYLLYLCIISLNIKEISFIQSLFIIMVINMGLLIPAAPGNIGTFEFSTILALQYLGVDKTLALSLALFYHLIQVIPTTLAGFLALSAVNINLKALNVEKFRNDPCNL